MTKLAFINIDRILTNGDKRFALAEEAKQKCLAMNGTRSQSIDCYWRTAFNAEHIALDVPIDGAREALNAIEEKYDVIFLTSRPEFLRRASLAWLKQHHYMGISRDMLMKPSSFQYTKTTVWKAGTIHQTAALYGATEVLVIDDEQANLDEVQKYEGSFLLRCFTSLEMKEPEPVASDEEDDDHPF